MAERGPGLPVSLFRCARLAVHLVHAALLAMAYPHSGGRRQRRMLKEWSRQLLRILDIGIRIENIDGQAIWQQPAPGETGRLIVANHVSWLDIFVLNAICPSRFIAKAEVRDWPFIGWLCQRSGTLFIERAMRQNAAQVNRRIGLLLGQGACIGLFPEGTTTDGRQVGHFHSALLQPAIDAGASLCPVALHYQDSGGNPGEAAAFTGSTTLSGSIWRILRSPRFDALLVLTPALPTVGANRRVLARAAQEAVAQGLEKATVPQRAPEKKLSASAHPAPFSSQSTYALLVEPEMRQLPE